MQDERARVLDKLATAAPKTAIRHYLKGLDYGHIRLLDALRGSTET